MADPQIFLPGEQLPSDSLPRPKKGTITLGPGLRHIPPSTFTATTAGALQVDHRKAAVWLEPTNGRYLPTVGDLVVAQVHHSASDNYFCSLVPHSPLVTLGHLAFEGASRKSRPVLKSGDLVYARIAKVPTRSNGIEDVEIECFNSGTGKAEGMGPLKGGMLFDITPAFARRLMMGTEKEGRSKGGVVVLEELGEKARFEVAVGRNGRIWVEGGDIRTTLAVGKCLKDTDEKALDVEEQRKLVRKVTKDPV